MENKPYFIPFVVFCFIFMCSVDIFAQEAEGEVIVIHGRVGPVIDISERTQYGLFPDIDHFQLAVFSQKPDSTYLLKIICLNEETGEETVQQHEVTASVIDAYREKIASFWANEIEGKAEEDRLKAARDVPDESMRIPDEGKPVIVSLVVGEVIDREERDRYSLFPGITNFHSALFLMVPSGIYALQINTIDLNTGKQTSQRFPTSSEVIEQNRKKIEEGLKTVKLTLHDGTVHSGLMIHALGGGIQTDQMFYARPDITRVVIKGKFHVWEYMGAGFFLGIAYRLAAHLVALPLITSEGNWTKQYLYHGLIGAVPGLLIGALVSSDTNYDFTRSDRDIKWTSFVKKYGQ